MVGYTLNYNSLDNNRNPTGGFFAELRQDVAGAGGDDRFVRTTGDLRYYHEIYDQIVGLVHLQGGDLAAWGGTNCALSTISTWGQASFADLRQAASVRATLVPGTPRATRSAAPSIRCQHGNAVPHLWLAEGSRSEGRHLC